MQNKSNIPYRLAIRVTVGLAALTLAFLLWKGKNGSFMWVNERNSPALDTLFTYITYLGDGVMWVPLGIYCLIFNRRFTLTVIVAILLSTAFTHIFKQLIWPHALRPASLQDAGLSLHFVDGIKINRIRSFPSGHTGQAFTMALLIAYLVNRKYWGWILPLLAFAVGYSRIYLSQHFVSDVLGGMGVGLLTAVICIWGWRKWGVGNKGWEKK